MSKKTEKTKGTQVDLNSGELKKTIKHVIDNNKFLQKKGIKPIAVEILGDAGLGKTSVIRQIGKEEGLDVVKLNLAQLEEIGDLVGSPLKQYELTKDGDNIWVNEVALKSKEADGFQFTGNSRTTYAVPEWLAGKTKGFILLLDDFSRAEHRFIQAAMEIILEQEYVSWKLPEGSTVILTSNPDNGDYHVNMMDDAQKTRYVSFGMKWDKKEWASWAENFGLDSRGINFVLLNGEIMDKNARCNPRSYVTFLNAISSIQDFNSELPLIQMIGEGSIGPEVTQMFTMFINNKLDKLVDPEWIMNTDKPYKEVKETIEALVGNTKAGTYRADIGSTLNTRILNYSLTFSKDNPITDKYIDRLTNIIMDKIFGVDLDYHTVKTLFENQKFKGLSKRKEMTQYVVAG